MRFEKQISITDWCWYCTALYASFKYIIFLFFKLQFSGWKWLERWDGRSTTPSCTVFSGFAFKWFFISTVLLSSSLINIVMMRARVSRWALYPSSSNQQLDIARPRPGPHWPAWCCSSSKYFKFYLENANTNIYLRTRKTQRWWKVLRIILSNLPYLAPAELELSHQATTKAGSSQGRKL